MKVIHPSLFLVMKNFPDSKADLQQLYRKSESFQTLCQNYQDCSKALDYWGNSKNAQATERQREYEALLKELKMEIIHSLELIRRQI